MIFARVRRLLGALVKRFIDQMDLNARAIEPCAAKKEVRARSELAKTEHIHIESSRLIEFLRLTRHVMQFGGNNGHLVEMITDCWVSIRCCTLALKPAWRSMVSSSRNV